ncbi:MAG: hypothetical protein ACI861_000446 [Paracoccaceae bacterium]|jgi:hypothetical protein
MAVLQVQLLVELQQLELSYTHPSSSIPSGSQSSPASVASQAGMTCESGCEALYLEIDRFVRIIKRRYYQYLEDAHGLPGFGKNSRAGHRQAFFNAQQGLKNRLHDADAIDCKFYRVDAWHWATKNLR